jgi:hypothetical protein
VYVYCLAGQAPEHSSSRFDARTSSCCGAALYRISTADARRRGGVVSRSSDRRDRATDEFWAILPDEKNRLLDLAQIGIGCLTCAVVNLREVYGPAVRLGADAVIVAHSHPSGDAEPSRQELELTQRLARVREWRVTHEALALCSARAAESR